MTKHPPGHRPGDYIINKCMPNATPEQKEAARENLKGLALILAKIQRRIALEKIDREEAELRRRRKELGF